MKFLGYNDFIGESANVSLNVKYDDLPIDMKIRYLVAKRCSGFYARLSESRLFVHKNEIIVDFTSKYSWEKSKDQWEDKTLTGTYRITPRSIYRKTYGEGLTPVQKKKLDEQMLHVSKKYRKAMDMFYSSRQFEKFDEFFDPYVAQDKGEGYREDFKYCQAGLCWNITQKKPTFLQVNQVWENVNVASGDRDKRIIVALYNDFKKDEQSYTKIEKGLNTRMVYVYESDIEKQFGKEIAWKFVHMFPVLSGSIPYNFVFKGIENIVEIKKDKIIEDLLVDAIHKDLVTWNDVKYFISEDTYKKGSPHRALKNLGL